MGERAGKCPAFWMPTGWPATSPRRWLTSRPRPSPALSPRWPGPISPPSPCVDTEGARIASPMAQPRNVYCICQLSGHHCRPPQRVHPARTGRSHLHRHAARGRHGQDPSGPAEARRQGGLRDRRAGRAGAGGRAGREVRDRVRRMGAWAHGRPWPRTERATAGHKHGGRPHTARLISVRPLHRASRSADTRTGVAKAALPCDLPAFRLKIHVASSAPCGARHHPPAAMGHAWFVRLF